MSTNETATTKYTNGQPTPDNVIGAVPVLAVVWCRSVGASWTLELHQLSRGRPRRIQRVSASHEMILCDERRLECAVRY
jgi:hypothetical protein